MSGPFRPAELDGLDREVPAGDLATAASTGRALDAALDGSAVLPSAGFSDRVMAALADEPTPRPASFLAAFGRRPGPGGFVASVRDAWRITRGAAGRPLAARGLALAYVLVIAIVGSSLVGLAGYGWAGALGLLDAHPSPSPTITAPSPAPTPGETGEPAPSATPTPSPTPEISGEPGESTQPEPSDDHTATPSTEPVASPDDSVEPSDDHGGGSSGPGGGSPEPTQTPKASETPNPPETPEPS
jgi:hypothetical protein